MNKLLLLCVFCGAMLACCATQKPRGPQGTFSVKVVPYFGSDVRVYVNAFERTDGQRGPVLTSERVTGNGVTGFVLPLGRTYSVHAYADLDGDGKQGPDDPSGKLEGLQPVADVNMQQAPVILTLPGAGVAPDWPGAKTGSAGKPAPATNDTLLQKGLEKVREVAPQIPVPPLPLPVPPPPQ